MEKSDLTELLRTLKEYGFHKVARCYREGELEYLTLFNKDHVMIEVSFVHTDDKPQWDIV